jgi:hypothetical protein
MAALSTTTARIAMASKTSPRTPDNTPAAIKTQTTTLLN